MRIFVLRHRLGPLTLFANTPLRHRPVERHEYFTNARRERVRLLKTKRVATTTVKNVTLTSKTTNLYFVARQREALERIPLALADKVEDITGAHLQAWGDPFVVVNYGSFNALM